MQAGGWSSLVDSLSFLMLNHSYQFAPHWHLCSHPNWCAILALPKILDCLPIWLRKLLICRTLFRSQTLGDDSCARGTTSVHDAARTEPHHHCYCYITRYRYTGDWNALCHVPVCLTVVPWRRRVEVRMATEDSSATFVILDGNSVASSRRPKALRQRRAAIISST